MDGNPYQANPSEAEDPLRSDCPETWTRLIEALHPESMLVLIEARMGSVLQERVTSEDIWQDVLLQAWRDRLSIEWRGPRAFRAWILTLIDHRLRDAANYIRRKKRGGGRSALSIDRGYTDDSHSPRPLPQALVASTTPSRIARAKERKRAMQTALAELEPILKDILFQRLFEQRTLDKIAKSTGLTVSAVRRRFASALATYHAKLTHSMTSASHSNV